MNKTKRAHRFFVLIALFLSLSLMLTGCDLLYEDIEDPYIDDGGQAMPDSEGTKGDSSLAPSSQDGSSSMEEEEQEEVSYSEGLTYETFTYDDVPAFAGYYYAVINNNVPFFTEAELQRADEEYYEEYSELDDLGRCGAAMASVDTALMPTGERGDIYWIHPTGWQKNSGYERTHLIAFQIAGENDNEKNLITATHFLNNGGMLPFEEMVGDYVRDTETRVLYRVTPVFVGDELIARGVLMEAESLSDRGEDILYCVFIYNVFDPSEHKVIDYMTGKVSEGEVEIDEAAAPEFTFVLNRNSGVFHSPDCENIDTISEKNKMYVTWTYEEMIQKGYRPCQTCNP